MQLEAVRVAGNELTAMGKARVVRGLLIGVATRCLTAWLFGREAPLGARGQLDDGERGRSRTY